MRITFSPAWTSSPIRSRVIFLCAVFCVFASFGFANDSSDMGRQSTVRFVIATVLSAICAVGYAMGGMALRRQSWMVAVPLFVVQFLASGWVARKFPIGPMLRELNPQQLERLHARLTFDGVGVIIAVCLGYAGFVYVSVSVARRYVRLQTEKALLDSEMIAAREVQRMLVPEQAPKVRGYGIESVYRPAAEVGGDFFQVMPLESGQTLVVIGDVSGKGLRAAMIVSSVVGMLGALTGFTEDPAVLLSELNRRLHGRTHEGFVTCLAMRLAEDGRVALASAGHPAPYLNGEEVQLGGSLPLGLVPSAAYEATELRLNASDKLVTLTDGVIEAQNADKVLFGFRRVESLLQRRESPRGVAEAAQAHGQNDDVTVVQVMRTA